MKLVQTYKYRYSLGALVIAVFAWLRIVSLRETINNDIIAWQTSHFSIATTIRMQLVRARGKRRDIGHNISEWVSF